MRLLVIMIFSAYLLSACGHKGPLHLPKTGDENPATTHDIEKK
ncbi:MAG: lipoprotein [Nitrosomonas sp.]|jgi:predicted small lipoprotein YifL|nr:lipoprotein [Nitrosomonas sp.]MBX9895708.1 lipoprotein [Nitrosomonas sp.]